LLDLKAIREDPEPYRKAMARRGAAEELDHALALDEKRRKLTVQVEELRAAQNRGSKEVAAADPEQRQAVIQRLRSASETLSSLEPELARIEDELNDVMARLPNFPDEAAPDGETEDDNVEVKRWGKPPSGSNQRTTSSSGRHWG
jgi:seryl-tRNA synthetase